MPCLNNRSAWNRPDSPREPSDSGIPSWVDSYTLS